MDDDPPDFDPDEPCIVMEMLNSSDVSLLREQVETYTRDLTSQLHQLQVAVDRGENCFIAELARLIAGNAASLGLKRVFTEACQLGEAADDRDFSKISFLNQDLRTSFPLGIRALQCFLEGL